MTRGVLLLSFPAASRAKRLRVFVASGVRLTKALQCPEALVVPEAGVAPPLTNTCEPASAVPKMETGEVLVE